MPENCALSQFFGTTGFLIFFFVFCLLVYIVEAVLAMLKSGEKPHSQVFWWVASRCSIVDLRWGKEIACVTSNGTANGITTCRMTPSIH